MADKAKFIEELTAKCSPKGDYIILGKGILDGEVVPEVDVAIPLSTINRHGLIAGATGTGKTKTLQVIAEQLSHHGIPSLVMDIKGDLSGLGAAGTESPKVEERYQKTKLPYKPQAFPVEFLTISDEKGVRLRSTVIEFGPILLSKVLGLNDTQQSIMSIVFKYCDDKQLPLIDFADLKKVLQYVSDDPTGKAELKENYGSIAPSSLGTILRSIVALEQQGADKFFGEPSFDVDDLLGSEGDMGVINIMRVVDIQDKPDLFSTFMLSLLAEIYQKFPEKGDAPKPELVLFIDEAHLIFDQASKALLSQITSIVKLIRSKGVGIFFVTQIPSDIPDEVLSQLGLKVQHALRGFTAKDKNEINKAVQNYPTTEYYNASELIQNMGIGEAFVTALDEKGIPTPLVDTFLITPESRMDILSPQELSDLVDSSELAANYARDADKESAYEILTQRLQTAVEAPVTPTKTTQSQGSFFDDLMKNPLTRSMGTTLARGVARQILGKIFK